MVSLYFMANLGTAMFLFLYQIFATLLYLFLYPLRNNLGSWMQSKMKKLGKSLFLQSWIVLTKESYIIVVLTASISFQFYFKFDTMGDKS